MADVRLFDQLEHPFEHVNHLPAVLRPQTLPYDQGQTCVVFLGLGVNEVATFEDGEDVLA